MRPALFGRGENLKSDANAAWLIKKKTDRMAAANFLIFYFTPLEGSLLVEGQRQQTWYSFWLKANFVVDGGMTRKMICV